METVIHPLPILSADEIIAIAKCDICGETSMGFRYYKGYRICSKHLDKEFNIDLHALSKLAGKQERQGVTPNYTFSDKNIVTLDTEFTNLMFERAHPISIQFHNGVEECVFIADVRQWEAERIRGYVKTINDSIIVGHNLSSDLSVLYRYGARPKIVFDTMVAASVIEGFRNKRKGKGDKNATSGYSLEACIRRYVPEMIEKLHKETRSIFIDMDRNPEVWDSPFDGETLDYIENDVWLTKALYKSLCKILLKRTELWPVINLENKVVLPVAMMQSHGVPVNFEKWQQLIMQLDPKIDEYTKELHRVLGEAHFRVQQGKREYVNQCNEDVSRLVDEEKVKGGNVWDCLPVEYVKKQTKQGKIVQVVSNKKNGLTRVQYVSQEVARWKKHQNIKAVLPKAIVPFNVGSRDHILSALAEQFGVTLVDINGKASLAKKTVARAIARVEYSEEFRSCLKTFQSIKELLGLQSKFGLEFLARFVREDEIFPHCVYPKLNSMGTDTRRFSSNDPNFQQIAGPKKYKHLGINIRECFEIPADYPYMMLGGDLTAAEIYIAAALSGDDTLLGALAAGTDVYSEIGILLFKLPANVTRVDGKLAVALPNGQDARAVAKALVLGINYGKGPGSLSEEIGTSVDEAKRLLGVFQQQFPKLHAYLVKCEQFTKLTKRSYTKLGGYRDVELGYKSLLFAMQQKLIGESTVSDLASLIGAGNQPVDEDDEDDYDPDVYEEAKRLYHKKMNSDFSEIKTTTEKIALGHTGRQGRNTPIQGGCADIIKLAMVMFYEEIMEQDLEKVMWLVATVHDELIAVCHVDYVQLGQKMLSDAMTEAFLRLYSEAPVRPVEIWVSKHWEKG